MAKYSQRANHPVTLVDDDLEFSLACVAELRAAGFPCVHHATVASALEAARAGQGTPLVLLDLLLPGEDPFVATVAFRLLPSPPAIVVLTGAGAGDDVFQALRAGAVGYVLKNDVMGRVPEVLDEVIRGGSPMSPSIARRVVEAFRPPPSNGALTPRELDVLRLLAQGNSYAEVGAALDVALDTVRSHVRRIYEKLHVANKAEAVAMAMRGGFLS